MTKILYDAPNENELLLLEKKELKEMHCGKCGATLWVCIYYTPQGRYLKKIFCEKCHYAIWTE